MAFILTFLSPFLFIINANADAPLIQPGDRWSTTLFEFSVAGSKGEDGKDGVSYKDKKAANGSGGFAGSDGSAGSDGRDGGDGSEAKPGIEGGQQDLRFEIPAEGTPGLVTVTGYMQTANGSKNSLNGHKVVLDTTGFIRPVSRGGQGGMGGYGGFGEHAGDGGDGGNGIGNQAGGDGGRGGRGGDAGAGKNGAKAGPGGVVRIGIPADQLEIAWIVDPSVQGGLGGTHGEHGKPGDGGRGGSGGQGGTYTVTVTKTRHGTDSNGKPTSEEYQEQETRHAANGSSGSRGSAGASVTTPLENGKDGAEGKIEWYIVDAQGNESLVTDSRYSLNLVGFRFEDINAGNKPDGIFEPGETGKVTNLFIKNNGKLPTPKGARTRMKIVSGAYFLTDAIEFDLPEGLEPGEVRQVKDKGGKDLEIPFKAKDIGFEVPGTEPFIRKEMIRPTGLADIAQIIREIPEFNNDPKGVREFTIQFPVMIEPIQTPPSLARGEAGRFIFKMTNISGQDFGSESEIRRQLEFFIKREGGDLGKGDIEFYSTDGNPLGLENGFLNQIVNLKANQSRIIEFHVGVSGAADSYTSAVSKLDLTIDRLGTANGEGLKTIQRRVQVLNIADDYFKTPDSDFLLVANHTLSRSAYLAWKKLAEERLQTTVDIWDLSYKNFIQFMQKLTEDKELEQKPDGYSEHRTSLAEDFAGKTIILLADDFGDTSGQARDGKLNVWNYVSVDDLRRAAVKYKINIRIIGANNESKTIQDFVTPQAVEENRVEYSTIDELLKSIDKSTILQDSTINDRDYWEVGLSAPVRHWRWFTKSKPNYVLRKAQQLLDLAQGQNPDADYMVVHHFSGEVQKRHGVLWNIAWFGKTWLEGDVEIIRSVKGDTGNVVSTQADPWVNNSSDYVLSNDNLLSLLLARSFETNFKQLESYVARYDQLTADQKAVVPVLVEAVLKMLVLEQVSLRSRLEAMPNSKSKLAERLNYFEFLMSHRFEITPTTPNKVQEILMGMIVDLEVYSLGQRRWWEKYLLLNGTKNAKIARYTKVQADRLVQKWFGSQFSKKEIVAKMKAALQQKNIALTKARKSKTWAEVTLQSIGIADLIQAIPSFDSIISRKDFEALQERAALRESGVIVSTDSAQSERQEMKVTNPMILNSLSQAEQQRTQVTAEVVPPAPPVVKPHSVVGAKGPMCSEIFQLK